MVGIDHEIDGPPPAAAAAPLTPVEPARRRTAAEEARTLVAGTTFAALATLSEDGSPWASQVTFAGLPDGSPVLCVSTLAEHGRNLLRDPRSSIVVAEPGDGGDPLARGRVTLASIAARPDGELAELARETYLSALSSASTYAGFGDFAFWVLHVERVRWVGGYGRMQSASAADYAAAEPDPVAPSAPYAVAHLNDDHADALLAMARMLGGHPDATSATCSRADRYGLDLEVDTPRGRAHARIGFREPCVAPDGLRAATVELARRARVKTP
jgi:putative heme iron utilization protein